MKKFGPLVVLAGVVACGGAGTGGGGGSDASLGSVALRLEITAGKSYCTTNDGCSPLDTIRIRDQSGAFLGTYAGFCPTLCNDCQIQPCPGMACLEQGVAITGGSMSWDGSFFEPGTCGRDTACTRERFAPTGTYTAVMCATPGDLVTDPNDPAATPQCVNTAPAECVEVEFEFPTNEEVVGVLLG